MVALTGGHPSLFRCILANMDADIDLIDEVLNELAPLSCPTTSTPATVMAIRNIIREALLKYDQKLRDTASSGVSHG